MRRNYAGREASAKPAAVMDCAESRSPYLGWVTPSPLHPFTPHPHPPERLRATALPRRERR
ncbi:MAG: hypothetical protein AABY85_08435, partial [Gemmatimonadota bacterium]